ncbi:hypothetical protein HK099_000971 [Clydaea vesicula]|uniref:Uncharacterized protein n=1 Tax=Clydaea vesicula TaxID=447962 RepID=A0AAD5XX93_9FUNG|nr:hypothetical protein HK099_000971 [Clydaea vesicula]KAJ3395861.1 hypothetical protein HDU92_004707 [Lobulomyces angularis]
MQLFVKWSKKEEFKIKKSASIFQNLGEARLLSLTKRFYDKFFKDEHLKKFVKDPTEPHGERLALYIQEKMTDNLVYTSSRPLNSRSIHHAKAWFCPKREFEKQGRRFKLDDCRIWMRLMFLSIKEEGLHTFHHGEFLDYMIYFIKRFIVVYERSAYNFVKESLEWSFQIESVLTYEKFPLMLDVIEVK